MSRYELYLLIHIVAAILWVGGVFMLIVLGILAEKEGDSGKIAHVFEQVGSVVHRLIIPSSLTLVVMGILMVADGPWAFDQLWIIIGLIGWTGTFVLGVAVLTPLA